MLKLNLLLGYLVGISGMLCAGGAAAEVICFPRDGVNLKKRQAEQEVDFLDVFKRRKGDDKLSVVRRVIFSSDSLFSSEEKMSHLQQLKESSRYAAQISGLERIEELMLSLRQFYQWIFQKQDEINSKIDSPLIRFCDEAYERDDYAELFDILQACSGEVTVGTYVRRAIFEHKEEMLKRLLPLAFSHRLRGWFFYDWPKEEGDYAFVLSVAISKDFPLEIIESLLKGGVDPFYGNPTPLAITRERGNESVIVLLGKYGAQ